MGFKSREKMSLSRSLVLRKSFRFGWTNSLMLCLINCVVLALLCTPASATFPGRGPPPPPPGPPRRPPSSHRNHVPSGRDVPYRLAPHKSKPSAMPLPPPHSLQGGHPMRGKMPFSTSGDLHPAAQTLYDLRGFHIPLGGQEETQRFLRQQNHQQLNDPFSRPSGFHPSNNQHNQHNNNNNNNNDPRTAPLVFPSFYQQQQQQQPNPNGETSKRPQQILNIFGHSQHLSQTKYEPADQQNDQGGGVNGFRPSQVDVASQFPHNSRGPPPPQPQPPTQQGQGHQQSQHTQTPKPSGSNHFSNNIPHGRQVSGNGGGGQQILNYRAPQLNSPQTNSNHQNKNEKNVESEEPFIYVYDDEDYEEGDEDDFLDKPPQQQINNNRVTSPRPTSAPLRSQVSTPTPVPIRHSTPTAKSVSSTTPQPVPINHQQQSDFFGQPRPPSPPNNFFFNNNNNQEEQFFKSNPFNPTHNNNESPRPVSVTPRPNVEINPSSERKPPPDQSNAIIPVLGNNNNNNNQRIPDDRFRRPAASSTNPPQVSQNNNNNNNFYRQPNQERQQKQQPEQQFFQHNNNGITNQRDPFGQVVNLNEEEEEENIYDQNLIQKLNPFSNSGGRFQEPPSRLRPVNTLVPKNRVPQEDIVLPPNFPQFHEQYDKSNGNEISTHAPGRGDVIRHNIRPQTSSEVTPTYQRVTSSRPVLQIQNQNQNESPTPTRVRGSSSIRFPTSSQTTTEGTTEGPKRIRNRVRPNRITTSLATTTRPTTTTTFRTTTFRTTTTPAPVYDETSQEYYEEDDEYVNPPPKKHIPTFQEAKANPSPTTQKSIRPFNNQIQELHSPKYGQEPTRRVRPTPTPQTSTVASGSRGNRLTPTGSPYGHGNNNKKFREQSTIESPPAKTTTGKPLYYAGKMLSKEGGLYAGQSIPVHHIYGSPVPSLPINSVFDKMPGVLDGKVARFNSSNHHQANQKNGQRVRGGHQKQENAVVVSTSTPSSHHSRLIHPSRIRPTVGHGNNNQPQSQAKEETLREQQPTRRPSSPKFHRPQQQQQSTSEPQHSEQGQGAAQPPRRRKIRPGQKLRQQNVQPIESHQSQVVSIRESVSEEVSNPQEEPPKVLRPHRIRPQVSHSQSVSTTEDPPSSSSPAAKLRPRRPRPNNIKKFTPTSAPLEEDEDESSKPARKLRPRARPGRLPLQHPTPQPDEAESVSIVTQSSVKISRKPTEAPGRFSSRFRDESPSSTLVATQPTLEVEETFPSSNAKPRTSFKPFKPVRPTVPNQAIKPKRRPKPQQQPNPEDPEDALPPSIRLSAKDVVLNRKPARRIPPGSASDRLKALQERRRKIGSPNNSNRRKAEEEDAEEDEEESRPQERVVRRRKLARRVQKQQPQRHEEERHQENEHEDDYEPQPNQPDTAFQNKREITHKTSAPQKLRNELGDQEVYDNEEEYNNNNNRNRGDDEYDTLEKDRVKQVENRKLQIPASRSGARNPLEVTSDEARSVLGIKSPSSSGSKQTNEREQIENEDDAQLEDENYYAEDDYSSSKAPTTTTEEAPTSKVTIRRTESTKQSTSESPFDVTPSTRSTTTFRTPSSSLSTVANRIKANKISSSVSTSTSASTSTSEAPDKEEASPSISSSTATSLKSRLRPNKKLLSSIQPPLSSTQQRQKNESTRHSNLSKLLKLRTSSSSTYSPLQPSSSDSNQFLTMATEEPSLPLESIFPILSS